MRATLTTALSSMLAVQTMTSMAVFTVAVFAPAAAADIGVDATTIGAFMSIAYTVAMVAGLAAGTLLARYGALRVSQLTMLCVAAGMAAIVLASPLAAVACAVFIGMAYGPGNPASAHVLSRVSSPARRPLIFSIRQTGVPLGGLLAGAAVPSIVLLFGWRGAALAVGGLALVVLAAVQPVRNAFDADRRPDLPLAVAGMAAPLKLLRTDPMLRALAAAGFAYAGCQTSVAAFFVLYLTDALGMPLIRAGLVLAVVQAGGIAGRLLWGAVAGSVVSARAVLAGLGVMMAACLAATALLTPAWPPALLTILALALGVSSFGWNGVFLSEVASRAPEGAIGQATGAVQFVMFGGVVVMPPAFGVLVAVTHGYAAAFLAIAAVALGTGLYLRRAYTAGRTGVTVSGKGEPG